MLENLLQLLTLASFPSPCRDGLSYRCQAAPSSLFCPRVSTHTASNTQHPMAALPWQPATGWNQGRSLGNEKLSPGMGKRGQLLLWYEDEGSRERQWTDVKPSTLTHSSSCGRKCLVGIKIPQSFSIMRTQNIKLPLKQVPKLKQLFCQSLAFSEAWVSF